MKPLQKVLTFMREDPRYEHGIYSSTTLARDTGVTKPTVIKIVRQLQKQGIIYIVEYPNIKVVKLIR